MRMGAVARGSAGDYRLARYAYTRLRMGTTVRLVIYAPDRQTARAASDAAYARVDELEAILSDYRSDSELSQLCGMAGKGPQAVSPELFQVLECSQEFSKLSGGAFDVTVGPVVSLWRRARREKRMPPPEELERARRLVGYRLIRLDESTHTVELARPGMKLDLGGIAKGYVADQVLAVLKKRGLHSVLVDAGGDIVVGDPPPGKDGWSVAVQDPPGGDPSLSRRLLVKNCGVATSGDAYQFVEINGRRYSHIVDPRTGLGLEHSASATALAADGMHSDAWATTLSVLPPEVGVKLVESKPGVETYIIRRAAAFETFCSRGFPGQD